MEASPESEYKFDKLVLFLQHKIKVMPPVDTSKPTHSLGLRSLDSTSYYHQTGPSLLSTSRKQRFRIPQTPATQSRYQNSRSGNRTSTRPYAAVEKDSPH